MSNKLKILFGTTPREDALIAKLTELSDRWRRTRWLIHAQDSSKYHEMARDALAEAGDCSLPVLMIVTSIMPKHQKFLNPFISEYFADKTERDVKVILITLWHTLRNRHAAAKVELRW